ncbi:unnamed protein product [Calypogeia fissa]
MKAVLEVMTSTGVLQEFWVGGNNFSGISLPAACFANTSNYLAFLDFSNCHLKGEILGSAFDNICLPFIEYLNLSNNQAIGSVPASIIANSQPFVVDVSNNNLSGPLPTIPPSSNLYNPKYFAGNDELCGYPLAPCPSILPKHATGVPWWVLLIIIGGSFTIAMGSCLAATWRWRVYQKQHQQDADLIRTLLERDAAALMPLRELKKATDNFAESARIGEGGFGTVYIGKLSDGTIVAIKRSKQEGSERNKEQFLNEVRILSQVNHRHLVKLLGCCMENKIAVLVFEFISNGTLQEHLQGKHGENHLSWKQRLNIAVQTADALHYLHSGAAFPIFHRDVKLDENLNAKVADFGISKLAPLHVTHVSTAAIQGTIGYIDPEYYTTLQLNDKSDVYGFGVVLLELLSSKPALDFSRGGDETSLVNMARPYIESGKLEDFIDPTMMETYTDTTHLGKECILDVGKLAMKCLDMQPRGRPSMNKVLTELQNISRKFSNTSSDLGIISEGDNEDLLVDDIRLLYKSTFGNSPRNSPGNSSTFTIEKYSIKSDIQMSQLDQDPLDRNSRGWHSL